MPLSGWNNLPRIKHSQCLNHLPLPTGAGLGPSLPEVTEDGQTQGQALGTECLRSQSKAVETSRRLRTECLVP